MAADWVSLPFKEAVAHLSSLVPVADGADLGAIEPWAAARAFTIAGISKMEVIQQVLDALTASVERGETLSTFASQLDTVFEDAGISKLDPWHVETIFRNNVQSAYSAGRWDAGVSASRSGNIWGWKYVAVQDDRTRPLHASLHGLVFKGQDHAEIWPPWDFGCRCTSRWIFNREATRLGLKESSTLPAGVLDALSESDFTSPALSDTYTPDLSSYDPALVSAFSKDK